MSVSQPYWMGGLENERDAINDISAEELEGLLEEESSRNTGTVLKGLAGLTGLTAAAAAVKTFGDNPDMDRRKFLAGGAVGGAVGTAGCAGGNSDSTPTDTGTGTDSPTATGTDSAADTATSSPTETATPSRKDNLMSEMRLPQGYEENFESIDESMDNRFATGNPKESLFNMIDWSVNGARGGYPEDSSNSEKVRWMSQTPFAYMTDHEDATVTLEAVLQNAHLFDDEFPQHTVGENLIVDNGVFVSGGTMKTADVAYENSEGELNIGINVPELGLQNMWIGNPENSKYAGTDNVTEFGYQFRDATATYMNELGVEASDNLHPPRESLSQTFTPASMAGEFIVVPEVPLYESQSEGYESNPEQVIEEKMAIRETLRETDEEHVVPGYSNEGGVEIVDTGEEAVVRQTPYSLGILD